MNAPSEHDRNPAAAIRSRKLPAVRQRSSTAAAQWFAGVLLLCAGGAVHAVVIEIPGVQSVPGYASGSSTPAFLVRQDAFRKGRAGYPDFVPAGTYGIGVGANPMKTLHAGNADAFLVRSEVLDSRPHGDLFAAIDAPYGEYNAALQAPGNSDPELWTMLLVAAGLVGYQIRRKSRVGAIRFRP
ncbi:MAG TPA: hypothetical protein VIU02_05790 [Burkholderiales bacterium]